MLDFSSYKVLTFDCYGTLVDWESGLATALGALLSQRGIDLDREGLLALHAEFEPAAQVGPFKPYREVLATVVDRFAERFGFAASASERQSLAESIGDWPVFPDTQETLKQLAESYPLAILSNIDDDLFALSAAKLGVSFEAVITAQQVGSYKPAPAHFHAAFEQLAAREEILHVAQSLFHDVAVARELGLATVWVNRRQAKVGGGATPPSSARPDIEVPDLASLAALIDEFDRSTR